MCPVPLIDFKDISLLFYSMTILIIENNTNNNESLCSLLKAIDASIDCVALTDAEKALALLNGGQVEPELILIDLLTPKVNGLQFFYTLKENPALASLPVWLISSDIKKTDIEFFDRAGIRIFMKNQLREDLITSVEAMLKDQKPQNPPPSASAIADDGATFRLPPLQLYWR
jgi:CheY-like chemotaxis protein